ncbi:MAG: hypothetical protein MUQ27_00455 [Acidimicrobiia bacterium]|nr:hypothetical protein [Acidimicrobiia bacterium]
MVVLVDHSVSGPMSAVVDADGNPVVAFVSSDDETLEILRCSDQDCIGPIDQITFGPAPVEVFAFDLALLSDGSPAVIIHPSWADFPDVWICLDPSCEAIENSVFGLHEPCLLLDGGGPCDLNYPSMVVGSDGLLRVVYITQSDPMTLKVATCQRGFCNTEWEFEILDEPEWEHATIDELPSGVFTGTPSIRIDSNDRLLVGYWYANGPGETQARVAVCEDASCAASPTILSIDGGVFAQTTPGATDDEYLIWYQTGAEALPVTSADPSINYAELWSDYSDFMVIQCNADGCADAMYVEPGEDWLLAQAAGALQLFTNPDGSTGAFFNHASRNEPNFQLHMTTCADAICTQGVTEAVGIDNIFDGYFDVITTSTTPRVVYVTNDGAMSLYTP